MDDLPAPIRDLAQRLGAASALAVPARIQFTQRGRMRQDASAKWMNFRAHQWLDPHDCQFDWRARFGPLGLVHVQDALLAGRGRLSARLFGLIPLASAAGPQATRGELMRYLAELAWCPDALRHNRAISWQVAAPDHFIASAGLGTAAATIHLYLDAAGRIASISAPDRPRSVGKSFVETPWWGRFADYRDHCGRQIPFAAEVGWIIDGQNTAIWHGQLTSWSAA